MNRTIPVGLSGHTIKSMAGVSYHSFTSIMELLVNSGSRFDSL